MATWRDYQPEPDDNTAAPPIGAPEGNYPGRVVNNTFRRLMAVVRNLGDTTPKISGSGDPEATIGSMAYQNATAVAITGGTLSGVTGIVPLRSIVAYGGNVTEAAALAPNWGICDGRTVNGIVTPDLRGLFIRAWSDSIAAGSTGGSLAAITSSSNGAHTHTGSTGSTALTVAQLPAHSHREGGNLRGDDVSAGTTSAIQNDVGGGFQRPGNYGSSNDSWRWLTEETGSGQAHAHSISSDGAHTHTVTPTAPPFYALIYIMRTA